MKKEFYVAKTYAEREQQLDHFIENLTEMDNVHFLKDTESGRRLDIRRVHDSPKDFFYLFCEGETYK